MRTLSKSRLLAYRQCPKRLWLEIHHPEYRADSAATRASFATGHQVGDIARHLYDPQGKGVLLDPKAEGLDHLLQLSQQLLQATPPRALFEAGLRAEGALALADVMLPLRRGGQRAWRMVEVKSSTSIKDHHRDDAAVQAFVARAAGVPLAAIALAHIDSDWLYPGGGDYRGLLVEHDLSDDAFGREGEVRAWLADAQAIAARRKPPAIATSSQCKTPYECGFLLHCRSQEPQAEHPIEWLPGRRSKPLAAHIEMCRPSDMRDVPDTLLDPVQQRVKSATLSGRAWFDRQGAARALVGHALPAYFMDFETIQFAVLIWKGTRPYQQIPFQFSVHRLSHTGKLAHTEFLDLSGKDPSKAFAQALIAACGERGSVFAYNAPFEKARLQDLAARFSRLRPGLLAIHERVVDLLPVARSHYYHPSQQGSWSIKAVLPALHPDLRYADLEGVQDGGMAMQAYLETLSTDTSQTRKMQIDHQLRSYCALDTLALVRLWSSFTGQPVP